MSSYVIITPAKNEEKYIEETIISVINQTFLPKYWIIVDDGSTDSTAAIIEKYISKYPFIKLVKNETNEARNFASKVFAIRRGFEEIKNIEYDYYCNLDADVSFEPHYFEYLIEKFKRNINLGICGGKLYDKVGEKYIEQKSHETSVAGPVQFFRRICYENIGGYEVSEFGLIDAIAEVKARMQNWETKTFNELVVNHNRKISSEENKDWEIAIRQGFLDYQFGIHPLWHVAKSLQRVFNKPIIIGSVFRTLSYFYRYLKREKRTIRREFIKFLRKEEEKKVVQTVKQILTRK